MSQVAICADVHVGNHLQFGGEYEAGVNRRCQMALDCLASAVHQAFERECDCFIVAGDLFDTVRPSPQVLARAMEILAPWPGSVHVLRGNHETVSIAEGDNSLAPFKSLGHCRVVERPEAIEHLEWVIGLVPYQPGPAKEWLSGAVGEAFKGLSWVGSVPKRQAALVLHMGLRDQKLRDEGVWAKALEDVVDVEELGEICAEHGVGRVYAGDWHGRNEFLVKVPAQGKRKAFNVRMTQIGALCPTGWDNPGFDGYGGLEFWPPQGDVGEQCRVEIPGPRFVHRIPAEKTPYRVFARVEVGVEELSIANAAARQAKEAGLVEAVSVAVRDADAEGAARERVEVATSAGWMEKVLAEFVQAMDLLPGVDRGKVLADAQAYLRRGSS